MTSANLDEKRLPSEDERENAKAEHEFHDSIAGYGSMPDDPDAGLSAEERAAIVCCRSQGLQDESMLTIP
jgi:hypothetical protein